MCVLNELDRFHLVADVIDRVPKLGSRAAYAKQAIRDKLIEHKAYICRWTSNGDAQPLRGGLLSCDEQRDALLDEVRMLRTVFENLTGAINRVDSKIIDLPSLSNLRRSN